MADSLSTLEGLLALLSDPAKFKQAVATLRTETTERKKAAADARETLAAVKATQAQIAGSEAKVTEAEKAQAAREGEHEHRVLALAEERAAFIKDRADSHQALSAAVTAHDARVTETESRHAAKDAELTQRETALAVASAALDKRAAVLKKSEDEAAQTLADLNRRLDIVKSASAA